MNINFINIKENVLQQLEHLSRELKNDESSQIYELPSLELGKEQVDFHKDNYLIDLDVKDVINNLNQLTKKIFQEKNLIIQLSLKALIEENCKKIKNCGIKRIESYLLNFQDFFETLQDREFKARSKIQDIEINKNNIFKYHFMLKEVEKELSLSDYIQREKMQYDLGPDIISICQSEKKYHLIASVLNQWKTSSLPDLQSIQSNFLFDKVWKRYAPPAAFEPFDNFSHQGSSYNRNLVFSNAINYAIAKLDNLNTSNIQDYKLLKNICEMITQSLAFDLIRYEVSSISLVDSLKKSDFPLYIEIRAEAHAIGLSLEKTSEDTVQIIIYNTGKGLHYHHSIIKKDETHLVIDKIPLKDFMNEDFWIKFLDVRPPIKKVHEVYEAIFELGKSGIILPASPHSEDYEKRQYRKTCIVQHFLAFFRYQIMHRFPGTIEAKMGAYKFVKNLLESYIASLPVDHNNFKNECSIKLQKVKLSSPLISIVSNQENFEDFLTFIKMILPREDRETIFKRPRETIFEKYYFLKLCISSLTHYCSSDYSIFKKISNHIGYSNFISLLKLSIEDELNKKADVFARLEELKNKNLFNEFNNFIIWSISYSCDQFVTEWVIQKIQNDDKEFARFLEKGQLEKTLSFLSVCENGSVAKEKLAQFMSKLN